jgi:beta-phosphoglucomutase-like phosphatase (HAD superfamily)
MTPLELVVFDMAGTTVRDDGQVPGAVAAALQHYGIEPTAEQILSVRGSSKREALRSFVPEAGDGSSALDEVYASFRRELAERYLSGGVDPSPAPKRRSLRFEVAASESPSTPASIATRRPLPASCFPP